MFEEDTCFLCLSGQRRVDGKALPSTRQLQDYRMEGTSFPGGMVRRLSPRRSISGTGKLSPELRELQAPRPVRLIIRGGGHAAL